MDLHARTLLRLFTTAAFALVVVTCDRRAQVD